MEVFFHMTKNGDFPIDKSGSDFLCNVKRMHVGIVYLVIDKYSVLHNGCLGSVELRVI